MKKKFILLLFLSILLSNHVNAQALDIVKDFGKTMNEWTISHECNLLIHIEELCDKPGLRISDIIAEDIISHYNKLDGLKSVTLDTYLIWLNKSDGLVLNFSDYARVNKKDMICKSQYAKEGIEDDSREYVTCKISVSGTRSFNEWVLISVRNSKIFGILKLKKKGKKVILK